MVDGEERQQRVVSVKKEDAQQQQLQQMEVKIKLFEEQNGFLRQVIYNRPAFPL